jgi:hypothetical protein
MSPRKGLDTKTDWLTDRHLQSDFDFDGLNYRSPAVIYTSSVAGFSTQWNLNTLIYICFVSLQIFEVKQATPTGHIPLEQGVPMFISCMTRRQVKGHDNLAIWWVTALVRTGPIVA